MKYHNPTRNISEMASLPGLPLLPRSGVPFARQVCREKFLSKFFVSGGSAATRRRPRLWRVITSSYAGNNPATGNSRVVTMVDPLEAKRLAAEEMERIKASAKFKRRRKIEAINGGWAMLGLVTGLVIEAHTGRSIPDQVAEYINLAQATLSQFTSHFNSPNL